VVELDRPAWTAGDTVSGTFRGACGEARVALERWEARPGITRRFVVADAAPGPPDGRFALALPASALPSTAGDACTLLYAAVGTHEGETTYAGLVVSASGRPHVDAGSRTSDRLLRTWDARHFHIELETADLRGGGNLAGRAHRHGPWPAGHWRATARCIECWRHPVLHPYPAPPQWDAHPLWEAHQPLRVDPDAHWAPFAFPLPEHLPPAVEGRTIAWRYELLVSRTAHGWLNETAAVTPLLFEEFTAAG